MKSRALDQFLQAHERQAFGIARAAVGNTDDALDLVQDAMMQLVKAYSDKTEIEWKPLFYRILNNRIMDHFRRQKTKGKVLVETEESQNAETWVAGTLPDGAQQLKHDRQMKALQLALKALPERQKEAFLLRCWEGQDTAQTAVHMGCSEGSVKTHYSRALQALRKALGDLWP
ncbi:RNA polymerase sigma factor [Simiduia agarivorans]|uniref:RNA polymerase factor sigma-70 n=1 Tax=Simiduia agarivorans (strain DSM 21679 / JCM 13881 / BCRC 17597 / SA1) TaxID=1117647 RepID=K4KFU7_SIMAS|nr:RNA polymerase sigma factor [Simiduia agarivorans]AFU97821.1 RNA polymerase factor sigma-70 [Simiduia agarivorans SA1 = DSM 21679]